MIPNFEEIFKKNYENSLTIKQSFESFAKEVWNKAIDEAADNVRAYSEKFQPTIDKSSILKLKIK